MTAPRSIQQPGLPQTPRVVVVEGRGERFTFNLQPGLSLLENVRQGFANKGYVSGTVELGRIALGPFAYVMPDLPKSPANAAFYSDVYRPSGITILGGGAMTFGFRDGAPFFHCHALWTEADGTKRGGHILPEEAVVVTGDSVHAVGLDGMSFDAHTDPEINFKVFGPIRRSPKNSGASRALAVRLRPNQDFTTVLEKLCADHGMRSARICGGVGSLIGVRFSDGRIITPWVTEVYIHEGTVQCGHDGKWIATVDVGLVDNTRAVSQGRLLREDNPVLMTFELVLLEEHTTA